MFKHGSVIYLINISLRILNVFLKGIFLIIAARFLSVEEIGIIGTIFGYVTIIVFFIGLEYWYYSNRFIKKSEQNQMVLINQFFLYTLVYFMFIPIVYIIFENKYELGIYCVLIVLSLHLSQETSRIFIFINKQLLASVLSIITQALWTIPIFIMWMLNISVDVIRIFTIYSVVASIGAIINVIFLLKFFRIDFRKSTYYLTLLDYNFISKGLKLTILVLISTLSYKIAELVGRFILESEELFIEAGVFTFYQSIINIIYLLLYHGVTSFYLPKLVASKENNISTFSILKKSYKRIYFLGLFIASISVMIAGTFMIYFLLKDPNYKSNIFYFYLMILGGFILTLSSYWGTLIYINKFDRITISVNLSSLAISFLTSYIGVKVFENPLLGISIGYLVWGIFILILNITLYNRYLRQSVLVS
jgi:hypothetical protein